MDASVEPSARYVPYPVPDVFRSGSLGTSGSGLFRVMFRSGMLGTLHRISFPDPFRSKGRRNGCSGIVPHAELPSVPYAIPADRRMTPGELTGATSTTSASSTTTRRQPAGLARLAAHTVTLPALRVRTDGALRPGGSIGVGAHAEHASMKGSAVERCDSWRSSARHSGLARLDEGQRPLSAATPATSPGPIPVTCLDEGQRH